MRKHDLTQPSEKSWGAFVDAGKAAAESRSQMLGTHRNIAQFVLKLDKESPEVGLHDAFGHADALHANFFEDQSPEESTRAEVIRGSFEKLRSKALEPSFHVSPSEPSTKSSQWTAIQQMEPSSSSKRMELGLSSRKSSDGGTRQSRVFNIRLVIMSFCLVRTGAKRRGHS